MFELNRGERRALWLATVMVLLGAAARLGLAPDETAFSWSQRPPVSGGGTAPDAGGAGVSGGTSRDPVVRASALEAARAAVREGVDRAARAAVPLGPDERIDPNTAPPEELDRLPGVGPATARAILEERTRGGAFRSLRDVLRVPGIGPARLGAMAAHLALPPGGEERGGEATPRRTGGPVDLNRADRAALEGLPGIGPVLAGRILELRGREGPFRTPEDLLAVPGIGPATLRRLEGRVVVR